jgi:phosphate transport system substrate-binding protein
MKLNRFGAVLSLLVAGALGLSACASDKNSGPPYAGSAKVNCGGKQSLKASGSTAQANAMTRFINAYQQACRGQTLTYTSNGSGAGISEFIGNQTDFGGSDSPLSEERGEYVQARQRRGSDAWNLPVVFGPLAITDNLSTVDTLVLDAPTAAKIFSGKITRWDDPAITALNESMPSEPNPRRISQRRARNHRQLPEVPRRRIRRRVGQGNRQGLQRRRRRGRQR